MSKTTYTVEVMNDPSMGYQHEYDIIVKETDLGTKLTLKYAKNKIWLERLRGKKIISILDTGDGVIIEGCSNENFGYDDLFCLRLLLNFHTHLSKNEIDKIPTKILKKGKKITKL